ncbi:putative flavonol 3-O-glucosyltransferase [Helianthus anomalus]
MCYFPELRKAKGIMVNTYLELETHAIKSFHDTNFPPEYPVGPILNQDRKVEDVDARDVISWSDGQPPLSVVVLCFGSVGSFNEIQMGSWSAPWGTGKVIGWAPQLSLFAHEAVGGGGSHYGWNSVLESLWFGVPTAAWPMYAEQQLIRWTC